MQQVDSFLPGRAFLILLQPPGQPKTPITRSRFNVCSSHYSVLFYFAFF